MNRSRLYTTILTAFIAVLAVLPVTGKGKYQHFKVSTYIRAQDVARMADDKFLTQTWETVSSQVDLDKIYLETHRDAFTVDEKTMKKKSSRMKSSKSFAVYSATCLTCWRSTGRA